MLSIRKSSSRGSFDFGWLKTSHSFSFGSYYDPENMGFSALRVINEDIVVPSEGFDTHPHRDMEIITYIISGALEHKDSMGNGSVILPGDVQYMSAGSGVTHSEFNPLDDKPVHLLQIWILPNAKGASPRYDQKFFDRGSKLNQLKAIVSGDGVDGSIEIRQDAAIFASVLEASHTVNYKMKDGRKAWIQVISGSIDVAGEKLLAGDAAALVDEKAVKVTGMENSEFLLFDLPQ